MNTKNAIFKIKYIINEHLNDGITKDNIFEAIDVIKDKLKRGEKYEKMYGKLKDNFPYLRGELEVKEFIEEFEHEYFPK